MKIVELTEKWMAAREPFLPQMTKKNNEETSDKKSGLKKLSVRENVFRLSVCNPVLNCWLSFLLLLFFSGERETASLDMDSLVCNLLLRSVCS